jgi:hypothetical protein
LHGQFLVQGTGRRGKREEQTDCQIHKTHFVVTMGKKGDRLLYWKSSLSPFGWIGRTTS